MSTTNADQFISQPDWWDGVTIAGGVVTDTGGKDASIARFQAGIYDLTLGNGGCDSAHRSIQIDVDVICAASVVDTSNTVKRISFLDNAGVATDPTRLMVAVRRLI